MQVELSEPERAELIELVKHAHAEINPEIHHSMDHNYRDKLRARRDLLEGLLKRLGGKIQTSN